MGEAKRRKEAGLPPQKKLYAEHDLCPSCGKTVAAMDLEHKGKVITMGGGALVVCSRCGNVFMPQSKLKFVFESGDRLIVDPNSPVGQATQEAAKKLVIPGAIK